jgi:hypothetical protein
MCSEIAALAGAQLRQLPDPDIPPDRDLYEIRPGEDDLLIGDNDAGAHPGRWPSGADG